MIKALLTIDDISSNNTTAIVDYLNDRGITALMFAVGEWAARNPGPAVYALQHGMIMGNHSYSHPAFSSLSVEEAVAEIERCEEQLDKLYREAGVERRYRPFRFPFGDKGGQNKVALQQYLSEHGFDKVDDTAIPYPWWKESGLDKDIDTFWTFDFAEYQIREGSGFTMDDVWNKVNDPTPEFGAAILEDGGRHIILMHAHDETEEMVPGYYRILVDHLLEHGVEFDPPRFIMTH